MTNNKIAKGSWQNYIWDALLTGSAITNPISSLQGTAKSYAGKYQQSFNNLLQRAKAAGYTITITSGPRGGMWSAQYQLAAMPL